MKEKEYKFSTNQIESQIPLLSQKGITEFSVHDEKLASDKNSLLKLMKLAANKAPEVYFSFYIEASAIDSEIIAALQNLFCSIDIPFKPAFKNGKLLFDKKFYAGKANLLNEAGIVFGFNLTYAEIEGDNLKAFMDRLDFVIPTVMSTFIPFRKRPFFIPSERAIMYVDIRSVSVNAVMILRRVHFTKPSVLAGAYSTGSSKPESRKVSP